MKIVKPLLFSLAGKLPLRWLQDHSPQAVLIPYQHVVSDVPIPAVSPLYAFKTPQQFEKDLDFLLRHFNPVTLPELIRHQQEGTPLPRRSFLLTFDDGLRQVYDTAMPILLRKGVPAALFVCPAFVGNHHLFYDLGKGLILSRLREQPPSANLIRHLNPLFGKVIKDHADLEQRVKAINYTDQALTEEIGNLLNLDFKAFLEREKPFMDEGDICRFLALGFHVGAHSWDHPLYSLLSEQDQLQQTFDSMNWVCNTFRLTYRAFAFPHVDTGVRRSFFEALFQDPGTAPGLVLGNRTARMEDRPGVLHRYIGENPSISAAAMSRAVLAYSFTLKKLNRLVIARP